MRVQPHPAHDALLRLTRIHFLFAQLRAAMRQPESELVGSVILQDIQDELLLNRLAHGIGMKGHRQIARPRRQRRIRPPPEKFQRFRLGRCGEGNEADAGILPRAPGHLRRQQVFNAGFPAIGQVLLFFRRQRHFQLGRRLARLG